MFYSTDPKCFEVEVFSVFQQMFTLFKTPSTVGTSHISKLFLGLVTEGWSFSGGMFFLVHSDVILDNGDMIPKMYRTK